MPPSPTKIQRPVSFKVIVPIRLDKENNNNNSIQNERLFDKQRSEAEHFSRSNDKYQHGTTNRHYATKDAGHCKESEIKNNLNHQLKNIDLRFKIKNSLTLDQIVCCSESVVDSLKNSTYGQVVYNRDHVLSEAQGSEEDLLAENFLLYNIPGQKTSQTEELPPLHQVIPTKHNVKVVERVCSPDKSRQNLSKKYTEGNTFSKRKVTCNFVASKSEESIIFDDTFADHVNTSLSVIESIEFLNDSMSLLHIEQKNKKAGADYMEKEKKKHADHFKRSAQLSHDSYEQWNEKSKAKMQQQVQELRDRKNKRDSTIESEYKKQQEYFQKKFEEDKASLKKKEQSEKEKAESEEAEKQRQILASWNNITIYEGTTLDILGVARKCVPDPRVDPEIEALLNMLSRHSTDTVALKSAAYSLHKDGLLDILTAAKFEQEIFVVYTKVRSAVEHLNGAIKRVNEAQVAQIAKSLQEEQTRQDAERKAQEQTSDVPKPEVEKQASIERQSSSESVTVPGRRRSRLLSSEAIVNVNIISTTAFAEYQRLLKLSKDTEKTISKFVTDKDPEIAKMRSALKLITVTPINSISASSNDHMANKVKELVHVLEGNETVRGNKRINPGLNKLTLSYCFNIAASKFVDQACEQVAFSDNLVSAFSIAAVITGIWQKHVLFGDLFLSHLHRRCPYSIPANWNKKDGETNSEYLKRLGYSCDGDKLEEADKFLLKVEGCIKLYAAVIQSPPTYPDLPHPHGLSNGWCWLSRILNLEPVPDVTATALEAFLQVAGSALHLKYKAQFLKLMEFLYLSYLPKLEAVTLDSNLGPITRLKLYLDGVKVTKSIPSPEGRITVSICK